MKPYYGLTEAAQILGYASGSVIRDYIRKGYIKGEKFGRDWVISAAEVEKRKLVIKAYKERHPGKKAV